MSTVNDWLVCAAAVLQRVVALPSIALAGPFPVLLDVAVATHPGVDSAGPVTFISWIDHGFELVAVWLIRMCRAVRAGVSVIVSSTLLLLPLATAVQFVASLEMST